MGFLWRDSDDIEAALKKWKPAKKFKSEKACETDIYNYLHEAFPDENFQRQYAKGKTRADIYVKIGGKIPVVVEVKYALKKRDEYHRLIGQVYEYLTEWKAKVIIVLCGSSEPSFPKLTKEAVKFMGSAAERDTHFVHKKF